MQLKIKKQVIDILTEEKLKEFTTSRYYRMDDDFEIDLDELDQPKIKKLSTLLNKHKDNGRVLSIIRDLEIYTDLDSEKVSKIKPRSPDQFVKVLISTMLRMPSKRLYQKSEYGFWDAYYVRDIKYHLPRRDDGGPYASITVLYYLYGKIEEYTHNLNHHECSYKTVTETLRELGYYFETEELRANYLKESEIYLKTIEQIGVQHLACGIGEELVGRYDRSDKLNFVIEGKESKVVIDVFREKREDETKDKHDYTFWFEKEKGNKSKTDAEIDIPKPEIPIHHEVVVFDLKRHLRLSTHINNLTPYVFTDISENLVLPDEEKDLVKILVRHEDGDFSDIIAGKSGGATVMLCGPPGTGKTLTAEVFAESEKKALYSVQCAQLGTDAEELEKILMHVFARANRWNAVLLLDEADVYVRCRGSDLNQNAIVGTFLRLLEYHTGILFMTTNIANDIDDAILSRCIARINYVSPVREKQRLIWQVLLKSNKLTVSDKELDLILDECTGMSGRDIKNVLKLTMMTSKKIDAKSVKYAKRFKPTNEIKV